MSDIKAKFVSVVRFGLDPNDLAGIAQEVQLIVERRNPLIEGFFESVVMANAEKTQLLVASLWESREAWAEANWDQDIGQVISDIVKSTKSFEVRTYEAIAVVRAETITPPPG